MGAHAWLGIRLCGDGKDGALFLTLLIGMGLYALSFCTMVPASPLMGLLTTIGVREDVSYVLLVVLISNIATALGTACFGVTILPLIQRLLQMTGSGSWSLETEA